MNKISNKGFTFVELLVVISILAILALVAMPNIFSSINQGKVIKYEAIEQELKNTLQMFNYDNKEDIWTNNNTYNPTLADLKKINKNLDIEDCDVTFLEIDRISGYKYKVCITCGDIYKTEESYCNY